MMGTRKSLGWMVLGIFALCVGGCGSKEHPEKGADLNKKEELAKFIEQHVNGKAEAGKFTLKHPDTGKDLVLTLDRVHKDRLSQTAKDTYFACADFKDSDGKLYDLDFWVQGTSGKMTVTETHLHKEQGKARYTWQEEEGMWKRVMAGAKASEHPKASKGSPEHPKAGSKSGSGTGPSKKAPSAGSEHPKGGHEHPKGGNEHPK